MDYSPRFHFWMSKKRFEKTIPPERKRKEKSNGVSFSRTAPSSGAFEVVLIHSSDDLYHNYTFTFALPPSPSGGWTLLQTNHTAWSINGSASFLAEKGLGSPAFFSWYVDVDDKNSSAYILNVQQSGLSLPGAASYMGDASNTVRGEGLWFS